MLRLGEFLIKRRAISPRQLWQALLVQQRASPSDIEVLDSLIPEHDEAIRSSILAYAARHDCGFLAAAEALGVRRAEEIKEATTSLHRRRCPQLGEILVKLSFVTQEAMGAHLEDFFRQLNRDRTPSDGYRTVKV